MTQTVAVVHAGVSWFLVGMIWTVQVVHYPLFRQVGVEAFPAYETGHTSRITRLVAGPWAVQGLTTVALLVSVPAGVPRGLVWVAAVLAAIPVAVTLVVSVPSHNALGAGFDDAAHARLLASNWLRTAAWSAHGLVALWILVLAVRTA